MVKFGKLRNLFYFLFFISILSFQYSSSISLTSQSSFWGSYWATDLTLSTNTNNWNDAVKTSFTTLQSQQGNCYIKNTYDYLFIGIELYSADISKLIINFDSNNDGLWAEDAKMATVAGVIISSQDGHYSSGNNLFIEDSGSKTFTATFDSDTDYFFFVFKIQLTSSSILENIQIPDVEGSTLHFSFDYFTPSFNDTLCGGAYPNYANSSNYNSIVLADSTKIAAPIYGGETSSTTDTSTGEDYTYDPASAAPGFSIPLTIFTFAIISLLAKRRKTKEARK